LPGDPDQIRSHFLKVLAGLSGRNRGKVEDDDCAQADHVADGLLKPDYSGQGVEHADRGLHVKPVPDRPHQALPVVEPVGQPAPEGKIGVRSHAVPVLARPQVHTTPAGNRTGRWRPRKFAKLTSARDKSVPKVTAPGDKAAGAPDAALDGILAFGLEHKRMHNLCHPHAPSALFLAARARD